MQHILLIHDGAPLHESMQYLLQNILQKPLHIDILYIIPQNLVHYGQVDQLASAAIKDDFVSYIHAQGVEECKEKLEPLVNTLKSMAEMHESSLELSLHVRWGKAREAIEEIATEYGATSIYVQQNTFGLDWSLQKKSLRSSLADVLRVL